MNKITDRQIDFLTEEETWQYMKQYEQEENKGSRIVYIGGFFLMIGMMFGVSSGKIIFALPFLAIGILIFVLGIKKSTTANEKKNQLIHRQIGPFAHREYEREIGSFEIMPDKKDLKDIVRAAGLFEKWTRMKVLCPLEGDYHNFHYKTGNVQLIFEEQGCDRGDDLDLEIKYIDVFHGIWMHLDWEENKESISMDEMVAQLKSFTEEEVYYKQNGSSMDLAIQSDFKIFSYEIGRTMDSLEDMKNGFLLNLAYEKKILDIIDTYL